MINEAAEDSADAAERISAVVVEWGIVLAGILTVPFPPAAMAVGLFCAARSFVTGAIAWSDGDRSAALLSFAAGLQERWLPRGSWCGCSVPHRNTSPCFPGQKCRSPRHSHV